MANNEKRHPGRPKQLVWDTCKVEGCEKTTHHGAFGMCGTHYMQTRRGMRAEDGQLLREPKRVRSYGPGARCSVSGCDYRPAANGLCKYHHGALRASGAYVPSNNKTEYAPGSVCLTPGCSTRPVSRGMCSKHAQQRDAGIIDAEGNTLRAFRKRERKGCWIGQQGYVLVHAAEGHPRARVDGTILEHRAVMEAHLGRYLEEYEIVHHRDGDRQNNVLSNLELLDGRAHHGQGHSPAHSFDANVAVHILLQQSDISDALRYELLSYKESLGPC